MPVAATIRRKRQLAIQIESVFGSEPAGTYRKMRHTDITWGPTKKKYIPDYDLGRLSERPDTGIVTRDTFAGRVEMDASFEDILWPLLCGHKGGVTGSEKTVSQNDYEWIFKLAPNAGDPTFDSFAVNFRQENGGASPYDRFVLACLANGYEISFDEAGDVAKVTFDLYSRTEAAQGSWPTVALPSEFNQVLALNWKLYIDDTWAAMDVAGAAPTYGGGAQKSQTVRSVRLRYKGGGAPATYVGDGRTDMSTYRYGVRGAELEMEVEMNDVADAERTKFVAGSKRYIRLLGEGDRLGTGFNRTLMFQGAFDYLDNGFGELGRDANGNDIVTLRLATVADDDANDFEARVIADVATYPA